MLPREPESIGRLLIIAGAVIAAIGVIFLFFQNSRLLQWIGRLPGDIIIKKKNFTLYFPLATSILLSLVLSLILWLFTRK